MLHEAFKYYFGGRLFMAPIESGPAPKTILDIGSGSGAWAIQAAKTYPNAEVLAVDLVPLPHRQYPSNLKFLKADLSKPFPPELSVGRFDIIHAQFVYVHLPRSADVLRRTIPLLRSGGWLLINDVPNTWMDSNGLGPGNDALWKLLVSNMYSKGMDPFIAPKVQGLLEASKQFRDVNVHYFPAPISKWNDPQISVGVRRVGYAIRSSLLRALPTMTNLGVTQEMMTAVRKELEEPWRNMTMDVFLVWAQKK